ncbi:MAG: Orn/Lys/Arg decarboxylase N-terminal domain-containing protein [Longicatena sp.]
MKGWVNPMLHENRKWPILIISDDFVAQNDEGNRLRELDLELRNNYDCNVLQSTTYEDALEIFQSRADIGCILLDWDIPEECTTEMMHPMTLLNAIRKRNKNIPVILITDILQTSALNAEIISQIDDCIWLNADTVKFLAGRIHDQLSSYIATIYPKFFGELVNYADKYKYAWHTPGHMGGTGFLRSPAGVAFYKFYGENTLRSDLSISVPELGSLLDHSGITGDAEKNSSKAFGSDQTYYVLNGTSNVNQIIWTSQVTTNDLALVDRNCHKSLNYAMVRTKAKPMYLIPRRNHRGIIGPVRLSEFSDAAITKKIKESGLIENDCYSANIAMSTLTNSTYDGLCYNVTKIKEVVSDRIERLHFDEAWFAYAAFHPIYRNHFGMAKGIVKPNDPPIFCSQSTHKLLTAFSQASMLHIKDGGKKKIDPVTFNESYMMYGSTSPQYSMIASLDVATKMMQDSGEALNNDIICEAIEIRKEIQRLNNELAQQGEWFFDMWQPRKIKVNGKFVAFNEVDTQYLASHQDAWVLSQENNWHNFNDIENDYVMLDPIKLTFTTPGVHDDGSLDEFGIPASVVTNFLIDYNIVCEKTDYYSFLLLNSLGTDKAKQGALLAALYKFKQYYDVNALLEDVMPEMVKNYPDAYKHVGLADHCRDIHNFVREHKMLDLMQHAFEVMPTQAMTPSQAFENVVREEVEFVQLDKIMGRIPAVMIVPYPPGIPIMMGGEIMDERAGAIATYLNARQEFENVFPGYESDIHGVERYCVEGKKYFKIMCIKEKCS